VGPHQVHIAALFGALLGAGAGMALAFLSWGLSARLRRPAVLPDRAALPLLPLAMALGGGLGRGFLDALEGALLAAGALALAGGLYWAFEPPESPEEAEGAEEEAVAVGYGDVKLLGALGAWPPGNGKSPSVPTWPWGAWRPSSSGRPCGGGTWAGSGSDPARLSHFSAPPRPCPILRGKGGSR